MADSSIKEIFVRQFPKRRDLSIDCGQDSAVYKQKSKDSGLQTAFDPVRKEKQASMDMPTKHATKDIAEKLNLPIFLKRSTKAEDLKSSLIEPLDKLGFTQQTTMTRVDESQITKGITERLSDLFSRIEREEGEPPEVLNLRDEIAASFKLSDDGPKTTLYYYKILKMLGKGSFGKVYMASQVLTNRVVAIKCLDKKAVKEESRKNKILHELLMFKSLADHSNVVQIYEVFENKKYFFFVMEYASGGDLLQLMKRKCRLSESYARGIFIQLVRGLRHIHSKKILHRDIKLDNILLIESDGELKAKICDFGVSRLINDHEVINEQCGTPAYIAPEIIKKKGYRGFGADVWSLGVLLYAMVMGAMPFKANDIDGLHDKIVKRECEMDDPEVSPEAKDLIERMLTIDPDKRINLDGVIDHPWMKNDPRTSDIYNPGKNLIGAPEEFLIHKIQRCGFPVSHIRKSLENYSLNHSFACYMTLAKDFE
jgi:serine/threonine protein kinase